jgi:arginase
MDAMGIATMLGLEGAAQELAGIGPREPLMEGRRIAIVGYDEAELATEPRAQLVERGVHLLPGVSVRGNGSAAATDALAALVDRDGLIVHFDVDVVDSTDLPLGQFPHFNQGVSLEDAVEVLAELLAAPDVLAVLITEINPDNDPEGIHVQRLCDAFADALGRAMGRQRRATR